MDKWGPFYISLRYWYWIITVDGSYPSTNPGDEIVEIAANYTAVVTPSIGLNVRSGPGTGYKVVKAVPIGTVLTVYDTNGSWYRVGQGQWCSAKYVKKI